MTTKGRYFHTLYRNDLPALLHSLLPVNLLEDGGGGGGGGGRGGGREGEGGGGEGGGGGAAGHNR